MEQEGQSVTNFFKVSLSGKSAVHLASAFQTCSEEHQKEFRSFSVEEQIDLLKVPVKRQARFKRNGLDAYLVEITAPRMKTFRGGEKAFERTYEKDRHQRVVQGRKVYYDPTLEKGAKNTQSKEKTFNPYTETDPRLRFDEF